MSEEASGGGRYQYAIYICIHLYISVCHLYMYAITILYACMPYHQYAIYMHPGDRERVPVRGYTKSICSKGPWGSSLHSRAWLLTRTVKRLSARGGTSLEGGRGEFVFCRLFLTTIRHPYETSSDDAIYPCGCQHEKDHCGMAA